MLTNEYDYKCCFFNYDINLKDIKNELTINLKKLINQYSISNFYFHLKTDFDKLCYLTIKEFRSKEYFNINLIYVTCDIKEYCNLIKGKIKVEDYEFDLCEFLPVNKKIFYNFDISFEKNLYQASDYIYIFGNFDNYEKLKKFTINSLGIKEFRCDKFKQSFIIKKTQLDLLLLKCNPE